MPSSPNAFKTLLVIVALLFSTIIGLTTGWLSQVDGGSVPESIKIGAGAFGATAGLFFVAYTLWFNQRS